MVYGVERLNLPGIHRHGLSRPETPAISADMFAHASSMLRLGEASCDDQMVPALSQGHYSHWRPAGVIGYCMVMVSLL